MRFARGEGRRAVNSGVAEALGSLHLDPDLDKVSAITAVLGTGVDLLLRLRRYELYPFKMSLMCSAWNEHYGMACLEFLSAKEEELDVGCGLPLQREALDQGTEAEALRWLQSPSCQDMLTQMWRGSCATNLPVERKHVETKRNEKSRLCHLTTAGRDQIQRHVLRQRTEALRTLEQAVRAQRRVNKLQISALAWERMPHLVMIPDSEIGKRPAAKAAAGRRQSGCQETLQTYIRDNKKDLMSSLAEMRLEAAAAVKRATPDCLTTTGDWLEYMEQRKDEFRERMRTATKERRQRSKRLRAREDLATAAKRILPKPMACGVRRDPWMDLLWDRHGWHALVSNGSRDLTVMFVAAYEHVTYALDVCELVDNNEIEFAEDFVLSAYLKPLHDIHGHFKESGVLATLEIGLAARARGEQWVLVVDKVCQVEAKLRQRRKKAAGEQEQPSQESDASSESSSGVSEADAPGRLSSGSSCSDSHQPVDSDVDSEVLSADGDAGDEVSDLGEEEQQEEAPEHEMDQPADEDEEIVAAAARHASGTWKVWEDLWFYMTETPGFTDIKMHMKTPFRTPEQMGRFQMSKALSPHHYGETLANPVKTRLLLRAWVIYRVRMNGWAEARPGRGRHVASMMASVRDRIRSADTRERPRMPLLEHPAAHKWLEKWVPDVVLELLKCP